MVEPQHANPHEKHNEFNLDANPISRKTIDTPHRDRTNTCQPKEKQTQCLEPITRNNQYKRKRCNTSWPTRNMQPNENHKFRNNAIRTSTGKHMKNHFCSIP